MPLGTSVVLLSLVTIYDCAFLEDKVKVLFIKLKISKLHTVPLPHRLLPNHVHPHLLLLGLSM